MTMTGNPHHDPQISPQIGASDGKPATPPPTDQELLTGKRSVTARRATVIKQRDGDAIDRELDRELAQSMDASDPPSITQP
jgi:hypothetical protein